MKVKKTVATTTKNNTSSKGKGAQPASKAAAPVQAKATSAKAAQPEVGPRNGVNTGAKTGIRVMLFQDMTLATNDQLKRPEPLAHIPGHLTDEELAKVWREEFPNSRAVLNGRIDESIVRGVRNLYNQGNPGSTGHGIAGKPAQLKPWIIGADGKRVQSEYTRVRKDKGASEAAAPAAAKGVKVSAEASEAATKATARKAAKVVVPVKSAKAGKTAARRAA